MVGELHADPAMGHMKKGFSKKAKKAANAESHAYDWRKHQGRPRKKRA
jgi:hypothetical protein